MGSLANRLEKLEKDLYMLTAMQHLMTEVDIGPDALDLPTRDIPSTQCVKSASSVKVPVPLKRHQNPLKSVRLSSASAVPESSTQNHSDLRPTVGDVQDWESLQLKVIDLQSRLEAEARRRSEAENLREIIAAKLKQKEFEVGRENDCKNGLLRLTLQMKTQLQQKCTEMVNLESIAESLKKEQGKMFEENEVLRKHKCDSAAESSTLNQRLDALQQENIALRNRCADLEQKLVEEHKSFEQKIASFSKQEQKTLTQINQLVTKCAQMDQSREDALTIQKRVEERLDAKTAEVKAQHDKVVHLENALQRSSVLHQCTLDKMKLDANTEVNSKNQKLSTCYSILHQTKELLVKLLKEKQSLEESLEREGLSKKHLQQTLAESQAQLDHLVKVNSQDAETTKATLQDAEAALEKVHLKNQDYQRVTLKMKVENVKLTKHLQTKEEQWIGKVKNYEDQNRILNEDRTNCRKELKNLKDNLSILQKISEDQLQSIQKLKAEVDSLKKSESRLKSTLRDATDSEEASRRKISSQDEIISDLEIELEYVQNKLSNIQDDLKNHSCEDYVESTTKTKLSQLETLMRKEQSKYEGTVAHLTFDRDKATVAAKRALNKVLEMKAESESSLADVKVAAKQELLKCQIESRKELSEKSLKIQSLESEILKVRQSSAQMQQSLGQKIHQLQSALNLCVGSFSQQQQQPHYNFLPGISQLFGPSSSGLDAGTTFLG